ncbi:MAG: thioredoxin [Methanomicrobium sp.]|nr:thioredoxin [Methanomicrobium sp.]MDD4299398.1 thioredoxin [Methanomicrobium sp.]
MSKPVLMDFYAEWCGPCKMQTPILEQLKNMMGDSVEIKKIDVDNNMDLAAKYGIQVVPTIIIEKDGEIKHRLEGVTPADTLQGLILPLIN